MEGRWQFQRRDPQPTFRPATAYQASHYMLGNLLWPPVERPLAVGAEFIYG